jgi:hypothetical protein
MAPLTGTLVGQLGAHAAGGDFNTASAAPLTTNTGTNAMNPGVQQPQAESPAQQALRYYMNTAMSPYHAGEVGPVVQALTQPIQSANTGQAALNSLEQSFAGAGGGQGMIPGLLAKLGGTLTGNNVSAYDAQRQQAMQVLSKLGIPVSALPDVTNTDQAAQSQFQNLQSILQSINGGGAPQFGQ